MDIYRNSDSIQARHTVYEWSDGNSNKFFFTRNILDSIYYAEGQLHIKMATLSWKENIIIVSCRNTLLDIISCHLLFSTWKQTNNQTKTVLYVSPACMTLHHIYDNKINSHKMVSCANKIIFTFVMYYNTREISSAEKIIGNVLKGIYFDMGSVS